MEYIKEDYGSSKAIKWNWGILFFSETERDR